MAVAGGESQDTAGILIEKVDADDNGLAGGVFEVEGVEGQFTTGDDGLVCVDGLPDDTEFMVTEVEAPDGYLIADPASRLVETDSDGCDRSPEVTFINEEAPDGVEGDNAGILIEKVDEGDEPLAGGVFEVNGVEGQFTTGDDGLVCVDGLPDDTEFMVTEVAAPEGYQIADPASRMVGTDDDGCDGSPEVTFINEEADEGELGGTPTPSPTPTLAPDEGELGGTPTMAPGEVPDTATGDLGAGSGLLTGLAGLVFLLSMLGLGVANLRTVRSRR